METARGSLTRIYICYHHCLVSAIFNSILVLVHAGRYFELKSIFLGIIIRIGLSITRVHLDSKKEIAAERGRRKVQRERPLISYLAKASVKWFLM